MVGILNGVRAAAGVFGALVLAEEHGGMRVNASGRVVADAGAAGASSSSVVSP